MSAVVRDDVSRRVTAAAWSELLARTPEEPVTGSVLRVAWHVHEDTWSKLAACVRRALTQATAGRRWTCGAGRGARVRTSPEFIQYGPTDRAVERVIACAGRARLLDVPRVSRVLLGYPLRRVVFRGHQGAAWIFESEAVTTRTALITQGRARYVRSLDADEWHRAPRGRVSEPADVLDLDHVLIADEDPLEALPRPGRFVVDVVVWCGWPREARADLRAVCVWTKAPGLMTTEALDGPTAERVRATGVQHQLDGLEEV